MIGEMIISASSSINLLTITLTEQHIRQTIPFLEWVFTGFPLTVVMIPFAWYLIIKINKPAQITIEEITHFIDSLDVPKKMGDKKIKVIVISCIMLTLWILSSWIREINVIIVAILGFCILCIPSLQVLDLKTFFKEII